MPSVNSVGEPGAGEPHARIEVAGAGNGAKNRVMAIGVAQPNGKPAEHEDPRTYRTGEATAPVPDPTRKLIERDYTIPQPQTAEEVISYYAKRIAQDVKLPSQFAALVPKVLEFLRDRAFGEVVDLGDMAIVRAIATPVAQYVTVKTFAVALRGLVVEELSPVLEESGRLLSTTAPFPFSRPTFEARKTVFNLVAADNEFERDFAKFLNDAKDVRAFTKLPQRFGFAIEYTDNATNLRYYEPDFVAVDREMVHYLIETKGREDIDVAFKDRAATIWCENATLLTSVRWKYVKVPQVELRKLQPTELSEISLAFGVQE